MSVEVIPAGASAVVTDRDHYRDDNRRDERHRNCDDNKAFEILMAVKDTETRLHKDAGDKFIQTIQDVKDAEVRLDRSGGDRFIDTIQDIKDAEFRLEKSANDRFIRTIEDVKDGELATERSKSKVLENLKQAELESLKAEYGTRQLMDKEFCEVKGTVNRVERDLSLQFKESALQLAAAEARLAAQTAKCCCESELRAASLTASILADGQKTRDLINANETAGLRERLSDAKAALRSKRVFSPAPTGTLLAVDDC